MNPGLVAFLGIIGLIVFIIFAKWVRVLLNVGLELFYNKEHFNRDEYIVFCSICKLYIISQCIEYGMRLLQFKKKEGGWKALIEKKGIRTDVVCPDVNKYRWNNNLTMQPDYFGERWHSVDITKVARDFNEWVNE